MDEDEVGPSPCAKLRSLAPFIVMLVIGMVIGNTLTTFTQSSTLVSLLMTPRAQQYLSQRNHTKRFARPGEINFEPRHFNSNIVLDSPHAEFRAGAKFLVDNGTYMVCLPSFVVNGVQKGGTTELSLWLREHPGVARFRRHEVHFWDCLAGSPGEFRHVCKKMPWNGLSIANALPLYFEQSPRLIPDRNTTIQCYEKSPAYFDLSRPKLIERHVPGMKMLSILRNPTDRLYSAYWHLCKKRGSKVITYDESCGVDDFSLRVDLLINEMHAAHVDCATWKPQLHNSSKKFHRIFGNGRYHSILKNWYDVYGDRYHVSFFEDFAKDPFALMNEIQDFLGLTRFDYKTITKQDERGYWVLKWESGSRRISRYKTKTKHGYPSLPQKIRAKVDALYMPCLIASCDILQQVAQKLPKYLASICEKSAS